MALIAVSLVLSATLPLSAGKKAGGVSLRTNTDTVYDIQYAGEENFQQQLDIYFPKTNDSPVIVFIHGGGFVSGSKEMIPFDPGQVTARGYALVSINYRLQTGTFRTPVYDCKAAIRWLRAHGKEFGLDTRKIGVFGESAGGYLASFLGTSNGARDCEGDLGNADQSSSVQAVCSFFGPLVGPMRMGERADQGNVCTRISKDTAPFLIMHGKKDSWVPWGQSETLHRALRAHDIESELVLFDDAEHGHLSPDIFYSVGNTNRVFDFFDKYLHGGDRNKP